MIVRLRMEIQDKIGNDVNYYFDTIDTHRPYAMATCSAFIAQTALRWQGNGELARTRTAMPTAMKSSVMACGSLN